MTGRIRDVLLTAAVVAACIAGAAPAASAGVPHTPFKVLPAAAGTSSVFTASWKVDRQLKRGERFGFEISVVGSGPTALVGSPGGYNCATKADSPSRVLRKGAVLRATFRPGVGRFGPQHGTTWCPGTARIVLFRYPYGKDTSISRSLGLRKVPITLAPGETVPFTATPVKVTLLPGSTLTATATGRPDRSTPLTGVLRGTVDGPFGISADLHVISFAGALTPASLPPDPLCPGTAPPATFDVAAGTRLDVTARGAVSVALNLNGAPSQIFGCGPPGALAGTTALTLAGTAGGGLTGLSSVAAAGAAPGFALPDGTQGGLTANLVLNVELSGS